MAKKKKKSTKGKRKQPYKLKLPKETIYTLSSTGLILIGALIMVSLSRQSPFLELIYNYFSGAFGWGILLLPFIFLSSGLMLTRLKWKITKPNVFVGSLVLLISLTSITKAGTIGQEVWNSLVALIYRSGAFIVLLAGIFISFVIIFETSLEDILLNLQKLIAKIKESLDSIQSKKKPLFKPGDSSFTVKGMDSDETPKPSITKLSSEEKNITTNTKEDLETNSTPIVINQELNKRCGTIHHSLY